MIDLEAERGLTPVDAAPLLPRYRPGRPTHSSRVVRLITKGVVLSDGSRLRLEALRLGHQWITTARCVREFGERLAAAHIQAETDAEITTRPKTVRVRETSQASRKLDKIGL